MVRKEYLEEALQEISDEHVGEAAAAGKEQGEEEGTTVSSRKGETKKTGRRKRFPWKAAAAVIAAAAVLAGVIFGGSRIISQMNRWVLRAYAISEAEYPEMASYPKANSIIRSSYEDWRTSVRQFHSQPDGYADGLEEFWGNSIKQFLTGSGAENRVYSPLSVYMALAMTAELTDGNSRQQILDLLGIDNIEALRTQASQIWEACYWNDGASTSILASSLWLDQRVSYVKETIDRLTETYYASSYQGDLSSEKMSKALQVWLNQQTGGLLENPIENVGFSQDREEPTVMALASTLSYQTKWRTEFSARQTERGKFHSLSGDVDCSFMFMNLQQNYYWGDKFGAVSLSLDNGDRMWFILPDEGVTMDELLAGEEAYQLLETGTGNGWENGRWIIIHFYLPRFDVSSKIQLEEGLKKLGVTDVFEEELADFTPMNDGVEDVYISQVSHAARVMVDEEGVTAAAYTLMEYAGAAAPPEEEIEFRLDRPFLFAIVNQQGVPLFAGVVNQP